MTQLDYRELSSADLESGTFPTVQNELRVHLSEEAFDCICARGHAEQSVEVGGILVGRVLSDDEGVFILVETTIDALHAHQGKTELSLTHDTWAHINQVMDAEHPDQSIVGWYHTHPGFGIFLSDRDLFIHHSFFNLPEQLALVYDPKAKQHGIFVWKQGEPWRLRRYHIDQREYNWDEPRAGAEDSPPSKVEHKQREPDPPAAASAPTPEPGLLGDGPAPTIILAVIAVLLLGGLLLGSMYGRCSERPQKRVTVAQLREARRQGSADVVKSLNLELLSLLRQSLDVNYREKTVRELKAVLERCRVAIATAHMQPQDRAQLAHVDLALQAALAKATKLYTRDRKMSLMLTSLERVSRRAKARDPAKLAKDTKQLRTGLGQLYAELAVLLASQGDHVIAVRLLRTAMQLDPRNAEVYWLRLRSKVTATRPGLSRGKPRPRTGGMPAPPPQKQGGATLKHKDGQGRKAR